MTTMTWILLYVWGFTASSPMLITLAVLISYVDFTVIKTAQDGGFK